MEEAKKLIEQKDKLEAEIEEIQLSLSDPKYSLPLMDDEGFPLVDYETAKSQRLLKQRLEMLQNDHRELMEKIKHAIENVHRTQKVNVPPSSHQSCKDEVEEFDEVPHPFAVVDSVSAFSPAEAAGLKVGDRIIQIGSLTRRTFVSLYDVADVLAKAKGRPLTVIVNRDANDKRVVKMELTPRTWNGNGLIGAHVSALSQ